MTDTLRGRALRLLARREHTRAELARKLAAHDEQGCLDATLDALEAEGALSDERFVESYLHSNASRAGARKLAYDMRSRGVSDDAAQRALETLAQTEEARAREVLCKRFPEAPLDAAEAARQGRFLVGRGFGTELVRRLLKERRA